MCEGAMLWDWDGGTLAPPAADAPDAASRAAVPSAQPPSPLTLGHKLSVNN